MPYGPRKKSSPTSLVLVAVALIVITLIEASCITNGRDVICSPNHEAYTVVLGKTWRTENKDSQCK